MIDMYLMAELLKGLGVFGMGLSALLLAFAVGQLVGMASKDRP